MPQHIDRGSVRPMTQLVAPQLTIALRRAAVRATRAPSIHNTQPWRFALEGGVLEVHADWSRQLRVLDPSGRQLILSCGCAVFNARAALAGSGYPARVERFPDPTRPGLVARIVVGESHQPIDDGFAELDRAIDDRNTNRREFMDENVSDQVVETLIDAANREGAEVFSVLRPEHRLAVARLSQVADHFELTDPAYRAELRAWTRDDPRLAEGAPAFALAHVDVGAEDDIAIRDFDTHWTGRLPADTSSSLAQCLLLLGARDEDPLAWLRIGEALERMLLEIARLGYAASPVTQVIEIARTNECLRHELGLTMYPHVLLRIGRAPAASPSRRRRLVDMLTESTGRHVD
jgi:hypothetical protein